MVFPLNHALLCVKTMTFFSTPSFFPLGDDDEGGFFTQSCSLLGDGDDGFSTLLGDEKDCFPTQSRSLLGDDEDGFPTQSCPTSSV